jgi:DNA repair exonuclease SbcCD ATPase subunit
MSKNKIVFNWMSIQNIFSIGDEVKFDFTKHSGINYVFGNNNDVEIDDHSPDEVVSTIEAKNGCGKSAIFVDAIMFGLYGKPSKDIKKSNIVHRKRGKNGLVKICFNIGDDEYIIFNGVAPSICRIYKNGDDITKATVNASLEYIKEEILRTPYSIFKNSIILSVSDTMPIYSMSKAQVRDFTNTIFNLNIYGDMFVKVRKDINAVDREVIADKSTYNANTSTLAEFTESHKNFENDKQKSIDTLEEAITTRRNTLQEIPFNVEDLKVQILAKEEDITKLEDDKTKLSQADTIVTSKISALKFSISTNEKFINENQNLIDCLCEECTVNIQAHIPYNQVVDNIKNDNDSIDDLETKLPVIAERTTAIIASLKGLETELQSIRASLTLTEQIQTANDTVNAEISVLEDKLSDVRKSASSFETLISDYTIKNETLMEQISEKGELRKYLKAVEHVLSEDGVKQWVVTNLIDLLNRRMRHYLERMGAEFVVVFDANFDYVFHTSTGTCEYYNFSAGERMRINHATLFAFKDLLAIQGNLDTSILVCDEILDVSIDSKATNALMHIIQDYAKDQTVFLISHKESISNYNNFDNIIEICKEDGFTRIVSDGQGEFGEQI